MIVPAENRKCPPGREEREIGVFRNLSWLYVPHVLPGRQHCLSGMRRCTGSSTCLTRTPTCSPVSMVCIVHFSSSSLQQDGGIVQETE